MEFENSKSKAQQAELMRQIAAMKAGLERIKGKLKPRHIYDNEEVMLKQKLQQETDTILHIQSEHQQIVTECTKELQEQDQIKCAEGEKLNEGDELQAPLVGVVIGMVHDVPKAMAEGVVS